MTAEHIQAEMRAFVRAELKGFRADNKVFYAEGQRLRKRQRISCKRLDNAIARDGAVMTREAA